MVGISIPIDSLFNRGGKENNSLREELFFTPGYLTPYKSFYDKGWSGFGIKLIITAPFYDINDTLADQWSGGSGKSGIRVRIRSGYGIFRQEV